MFRSFLWGIVAAGCVAAVPAIAQPKWESFEFTEDGQRVSRLEFGSAEADTTIMSAQCTAAIPQQIETEFYVAPGPNPAGTQVNVNIDSGRHDETRTAVIVDYGDGPHPQLQLNRNDPLWEILSANYTASVSVQGGAPSDFHLTGSRAAISGFLEGCDALADAAPMHPLPGPLYVVGPTAAVVYSDFRNGAQVATFAPNTEVMSTNATAQFGGTDWVEVVADRGVGATGWVDRALLTASSGGATEYRNLNTAANLLIRAQPSTSAAVVGEIPPQATGIIDRGERRGGWVAVRYQSVDGWAAHEYLLPMVGAAPLPPPPQPYAATFGAWALDCDPCRHPEDGGICQISSTTGPLELHNYGEGSAPALVLRYYPPANLPNPVQTGSTMRLIVDGADVATLGAHQWAVEGLTGAATVDQAVLLPLITSMRNASNLTLRIQWPSGSQADAFSLSGLGRAIDDLADHLPYPGTTAPASCPAG